MEQSLKDIIAVIPENELRSLLQELAMEDAALQNRIRVKYSQVSTHKIKKIVETEIAALVSSCSDDDNFISYYKAADFETGLEKIMGDYIDPLLSNQADVSEVIPLLAIVFDALNDVDIDDDGEMAELLDACTARWETVLESASVDQREQLAEWMERHLDSIHFTYPQEELFDFYTRHFPERSFIQRRFEYLDKSVQKTVTLLESLELQRNALDKKTPVRQIHELNEAYQYRCNEYERLVQDRYLLMSTCGASQSEKEQFLLSQSRSERAQDALLALYKNSQQYDLAIQLVLKRREQAAAARKDGSWFSRELIGLYRSAGDTEHYIAELRSYVHTNYQYGTDYILLLRAALSQSEWEDERNSLLRMKNLSAGVKATIYFEDKMLDDLMALLESTNDYFLLHTYEHQLFDQYAARLLPLRLKEIDQLVYSSADRKTYARLAALLKQLLPYPDGKQIAFRLIAEWKTKYRRPAMFDELSKAGFK